MSDIITSTDGTDGGTDTGLHNSVLLFGDYGTEVLRLSQLYDPKNDKYVVSNYDNPRSDTTYYTRGIFEKTVRFTEATEAQITAAVESGTFRGNFYEENPDATDTTGTYVPARQSLVVVDIDNSVWGTYTVLVVDEVDDEDKVLRDRQAIADEKSISLSDVPDRVPTYESTLVPINFAYGLDTATRAIDYNNDQLIVSMSSGSVYSMELNKTIQFVQLAVDRKLMMYGSKDLKYVIKKNNNVITSTTAVKAYGDVREFIDYTSASGKKYVVTTAAQYDALVGCHIEYSDSGETKTALVEARTTDAGVALFNKVIALGANNTAITIYEYASDVLNNIKVPETSYLVSSVSLVTGEQVEVEIYEAENGTYNRLVLAAKCTVKASSSTSADESNRIITGFDVKNMTATDETSVWALPQGVDVSAIVMQPEITYSDGSKEEIPLDNISCFAYGLKEVKSTTLGREYTILFKYFPNGEVDWSKIVNRPIRDMITCRKTIRIVASTADGVRHISIIPVWNRETSKYTFKFLVYTTKFESPVLLDPGTSTAYGTVEFDGTVADGSKNSFGVIQKLKFKYTNNSSSVTQETAIRLLNFDDTTVGEEKWLIGSGSSTDLGGTTPMRVYGSGAPDHVRPYLEYDATSGQVSVPLSSFVNDGVHAYFTEEFYEAALGAADVIITPTHFKVRDITNPSISTEPMAIGDGALNMEYGNPFDDPGFEKPTKTAASNYNSEVIVEFLSKDPNTNTYRVLYGVPVELKLKA